MITPAYTTPPVPRVSGPPMVLAEGMHKSFGLWVPMRVLNARRT